MNVKTGFGLALVLAMALLGTEANAEKPTPASDKAPAAAPAPEETLTLKKGEVLTLEQKDMTRVAVGDPQVADIKVMGEKGASSLHITGRTQGETVMLVWTKDGARKAYRLVVQG
jgi:Flp pilus assembly secretin CpaC